MSSLQDNGWGMVGPLQQHISQEATQLGGKMAFDGLLIWMAAPLKADVRRNKLWPAGPLHYLDSSLMSVPYHLQEGVSANRASSCQQPFSVSWTVMKQNCFGEKNIDESGQQSRPFPGFLWAHPEGQTYVYTIGQPTIHSSNPMALSLLVRLLYAFCWFLSYCPLQSQRVKVMLQSR